MRTRAENELLPLQKIAEQEICKALLTAAALAVLPRVTNIGMVLKFLYKINSLICFLFMIISGHNLIHSRQKMNPLIFSIPDIYIQKIIIMMIDYYHMIVMIQNIESIN